MLKAVINKLIVKRLINEVVNTGHLYLVEEFIAPDYIDHNAAPGEPQGIEGYKHYLSALWAAYSSFRVTINFQLAEGDFVMTRVTVQGVHHGEFLGLPASGKLISITGINIDRLTNGMIVEHWGEADRLGALLQIGAQISPAETSR